MGGKNQANQTKNRLTSVLVRNQMSKRHPEVVQQQPKELKKREREREFPRNKQKSMMIQEDGCCSANQVIDWQEDQSLLLKSY